MSITVIHALSCYFIQIWYSSDSISRLNWNHRGRCFLSYHGRQSSISGDTFFLSSSHIPVIPCIEVLTQFLDGLIIVDTEQVSIKDWFIKNKPKDVGEMVITLGSILELNDVQAQLHLVMLPAIISPLWI